MAIKYCYEKASQIVGLSVFSKACYLFSMGRNSVNPVILRNHMIHKTVLHYIVSWDT